MNVQNEKIYVLDAILLEEAKQIVSWQYNPPYTRYNMSNDLEDIVELMDGSYYTVKTLSHELIGFFCHGKNAQVKSGVELNLYGEDAIDIGIGMRPDLTGQGNGRNFLLTGLKYFLKLYSPRKFRLSVAAFNSRAISLYRNVGFIEKERFINKTNEQETEFIIMECEASLIKY